MKKQVIVVTAAYGSQKVAELGGQQALLPIIKAAGADGVEIRRELMNPQALGDLPALTAALAEHQLVAFYSAPESLYTEQGELNPHLDALLSEADRLNARLLKLALGAFPQQTDFSELQRTLAKYQTQLAIENDQTAYGRLPIISRFFQQVSEAGVPVVMTFDMANWLWTGEVADKAATQLIDTVRYIHVKAATAQDGTFRAIALDEAGEEWRTLLQQLPDDVPRGIEFPLEGDDLVAVTRHYVDLLKEA